MIKRVNVIGVPISAATMQQFLTEINDHLDIAKTSYICVANVHTTVMARENAEYLQIQKNSFLTLPDGKPLSIVGKKNGEKAMEQVRGVDFMHTIFADKKDRRYKHYFYGNTKENLEILIKVLKKEYPSLDIVGYRPSVFRELSDEELNTLAEEIKATKADFLWVALGAPRQEIFCDRIKGQTGAVPVGVGGAFNVLAHIVPDAPKWMKSVSLEWLYRLLKEPKRLFRRYFTTNVKFIYYIIAGDFHNDRNDKQ